jgi:hypothetical protein
VLYLPNPNSQNLAALFIINTLSLVIFILSVLNIKFGLYLFIFLIPLLGSVPRIIGAGNIFIILYLFLSLFLGFFVYYSSKIHSRWYYSYREGIILDLDVSKAVLIFIAICVISFLVTLYRYGNFVPFITNHYHNLEVNIQGFKSTGFIFWTIDYFFNYIVGFGLLLVVFNVIKKNREIFIVVSVNLKVSHISFENCTTPN